MSDETVNQLNELGFNSSTEDKNKYILKLPTQYRDEYIIVNTGKPSFFSITSAYLKIMWTFWDNICKECRHLNEGFTLIELKIHTIEELKQTYKILTGKSI